MSMFKHSFLYCIAQHTYLVQTFYTDVSNTSDITKYILLHI